MPNAWGQGDEHDEYASDVCGKCGATRVDQQLGLEPTPEQYVAAMVDVFREVRRVLRDDGTLWLNLGSSYASLPRGGRAESPGVGASQELPPIDRAVKWGSGGGTNFHWELPGGFKQKDMVPIPWMVAMALQQDGWYLRADIIWAKPNPMPESVTDRPTKAHEYVFLLSKSPRYFFDQQAVREGASPNTHSRGNGIGPKNAGTEFGQGIKHNEDYARAINGPVSSRNLRSVWEIATQPYPDAHFATFPEALPDRCIRAGTSERGCCPVCGAPWEREAVVSYEKDGSGTTGKARNLAEPDGRTNGTGFTGKPKMRKITDTLGWRPSCKHYADPQNWQHLPPLPCTVLDPFMGSGTTALVARRLGRRSIGIELNQSYAELCARRLQQLSLLTEANA